MVGVPDRVGTPVTGSFANTVPGGSFAGSTTVTTGVGVPVAVKLRDRLVPTVPVTTTGVGSANPGLTRVGMVGARSTS
ncbi:hypothetical protein GCM10020255_024160 [Rhodococcus baikonurensis]